MKLMTQLSRVIYIAKACRVSRFSSITGEQSYFSRTCSASPSTGTGISNQQFCRKQLVHTKADHAAHPSLSSLPPTMSCWGVRGRGNTVGAVELIEVPTPTISDPMEVIVKVEAASVNPIDVAIIGGYGKAMLSAMRDIDGLASGSCRRRGQDATDGERPLVVGRDFCGVVLSTGRGVRRVEAGQRVMGVVSPYRRMGAHAQYVATHQDNVVGVSPGMDPLACCSTPYAGLTAHSAAVMSGASGAVEHLAGKRVLVAGAAGGVGTLLVQMLRLWGAQVAGVCSADSFELLSSLGVTELYDYADKEAMDLLKLEHRFELVIDGSGRTTLPYLDALRRNGRDSYVTLVSPLLINTDAWGLGLGVLKSALELAELNLCSLRDGRVIKWAYYVPSAEALAALRDMLQREQLLPVIDREFSYADTQAAYRHMAAGRHRGKTVIDYSK